MPTKKKKKQGPSWYYENKKAKDVPKTKTIGGHKFALLRGVSKTKAGIKKKVTSASSLRIYKVGDQYVGYVRF